MPPPVAPRGGVAAVLWALTAITYGARGTEP